jgi:hypothetical protein
MPKKRYFIDSGFASDFARSRPLKPVPRKDPLGSFQNALAREVSVGTRARCWIWIRVNDASTYLQLVSNATGRLRFAGQMFTVRRSQFAVCALLKRLSEWPNRLNGRRPNCEQRTANRELQTAMCYKVSSHESAACLSATRNSRNLDQR